MSSEPVGVHRRVWAVVMAGGSGTRFWPASTEARPKQLTKIVGDTTMLQQTVARVADVADEVVVITTAALADETARQLPVFPGITSWASREVATRHRVLPWPPRSSRSPTRVR